MRRESEDSSYKLSELEEAGKHSRRSRMGGGGRNSEGIMGWGLHALFSTVKKRKANMKEVSFSDQIALLSLETTEDLTHLLANSNSESV